MCPTATTPPDAIGLYSTDEQIVLLLEKLINGYGLPHGVFEDINPYRHNPSNLPPEIWYLVQPNDSKQTEHGFWKAKGEACEIYQNGSIYGWRSTLEFYEGPNGRKTEWVMQEYKITQKGGHNEKWPKHSRALCTIFHCCGGSPKDKQLEKKPAVSGRGNVTNSVLSAPNANHTSGVGSTSESQANSQGVRSTQSPLLETSNKDAPDKYLIGCTNEDYIELDDLDEDIGQLPAVEEAIDPRNEALISQLLIEDGLELDELTESIAVNKAEDPHSDELKEGFIELDDLRDPIDITDGFLELNDLDVVLSHSSSSGNSSHRSMVSDDDFFALVRNMDDENNKDLKGNGSSYKCRITGPVKPEVIIQHAPLGSLIKETATSSINANILIKPSQNQTLGGRCQSTEKKVQQTLRPAATKKKFKKDYGVAAKLYCDCRRTEET